MHHQKRGRSGVSWLPHGRNRALPCRSWSLPSPRRRARSPHLRLVPGLPRAAGWGAARVGGVRVMVGALRVTFWGALAMGLTTGVGALFGTGA
jgi:hypothetical protein